MSAVLDALRSAEAKVSQIRTLKPDNLDDYLHDVLVFIKRAMEANEKSEKSRSDAIQALLGD